MYFITIVTIIVVVPSSFRQVQVGIAEVWIVEWGDLHIGQSLCVRLVLLLSLLLSLGTLTAKRERSLLSSPWVEDIIVALRLAGIPSTDAAIVLCGLLGSCN